MNKANPKNKLPQEGTSVSGAGESLTRALNMSTSSTIVRALGCPTYSGEGQVSQNMHVKSTQAHTYITTSQAAAVCYQDATVVAEDEDMKIDEPEMSNRIAEEEKRLTQMEKRDHGTSPFTRGGAVRRSPPTKSGSQIVDNAAIMQGGSKESAIQHGHLATDSAKNMRLTKSHERRGSLGSVEGLLTAYRTRTGSMGKRMRNEEEEEEDAQADIMNAIARLTKITAGLVKIVGENANTKMELKNGVRDLKGNMEYLNKMTKDWENLPRKTSKTRAISKSTQEFGTQTEQEYKENRQEGVSVNKNTKESGTQTEYYENENERQITYNLRERIQDCNSLERLVEIIDLKWPEESLSSVKVEKSSPLIIDNDWDIAIVAKSGRTEEQKPKSVRKLLKKAYPEALEILEKSDTSTVEYAVRTSKSSKKEIVVREKWIYVIPYIEKKEGSSLVEVLFNQVQELCMILMDHERKKKLAIVAEKGVNKEYLQKILVILRARFRSEIILLIDESKIQNAVNKRNKGTETLLVKGKGSYADTLK